MRRESLVTNWKKIGQPEGCLKWCEYRNVGRCVRCVALETCGHHTVSRLACNVGVPEKLPPPHGAAF
jgi:hypothetical protein